MGDLRWLGRMWRRGAPTVVAGLILGALVLVQPAASSAAVTPATNTGWRVIRAIGQNNAFFVTIVAFRQHAPWLGGGIMKPPITEFDAAVCQLTSGPLHQILLTPQPGTLVNGLSATSPANVWASLEGVPGGQVDQLTRRGWHPYSFAIGTDTIFPAPVVTTGPKNTWVLTEDINTRIAYGYRFDGSRWHRQVLPATADANSDVGYVTGSASNNIWALALAGARAASMRYNGSKWQVFKFPARLGPAAALLGPEQILALSSNNVWATVGPGRFTGVGTLVLLHWNGRNWSKITGKLPNASLTGPIASDGSGGLWLAAVNASGTVPLILHFSHGRWSTFAVPTFRGRPLRIEQLTLIVGTRSVLGTAVIANLKSAGGTEVIKFGP